MKINDRQFVENWQTSGSVAEAAKKMGLPWRAVYVRAKNMIKRGVALKQFATRHESVESLNALIESMAKGKDNP